MPSNSSELPLTTRTGVYRRKYHVRALFRSVAFVVLVAGYLVHNHSIASSNLLPTEQYQDEQYDLVVLEHRHLQTATNETRGECNLEKADPTWMITFYVIGVLYMFLALAIVCDEFFVPALEEMASERRLNLSMDVAGATLMAAGGSAPELFTSLFGTFQESEVGIGTIVGSAVFNVLFVIGCCALAAKELLTLTWWPLFRDCLYYAIGLIVLSIFVGVVTPEQVFMWEALVLFIMYIGYIIIMYFNRDLYKYLTGKELVMPEEVEEDEEEMEPDHQTNGDAENGDVDMERPKLGSRGPSQSSLVSQGSMVVQNQAVHHRQWNGTFRAGILKLLRDPDSWLDTAGVGIVAKISGDVDHVFREVDLNDDGHIDREELDQLFVRLECHLSPQELDEVFRQLDEDNDGKIDELEFTKWYMRSEERVLSQVKHVFDSFDVDNSGTIDKQELKMLLEKLEPRVTDKDVDEAIDAMYKSGSREEITFDEFSEWYKHSMIYERQKKAVEEDMQGVWENLKPPYGEGCFAWTKYILVFPLVAAMTFTIPDTQRPGMGKWCYFAFFMSILWIGGFSFLMVWWAEVIGNTIGIPSVVMGLTILAAGTSVPDLLSSVIVARRGNGDMAISSSIGSNIFDILVGLPIPWFLYTVWPTKPSFVYIGAKNIWISIFILLGMLLVIIASIHCQGWKLTKTLGGIMFLMYFAFLAVAIVLELPFEPC